VPCPQQHISLRLVRDRPHQGISKRNLSGERASLRGLPKAVVSHRGGIYVLENEGRMLCGGKADVWYRQERVQR
jgi:hypothetical protein